MATCTRSDFKDDKQRKKKKQNEKIVYVHSTTHVLSLGLCGEKKKQISHETRNVECLFPKNEKLNINTVRQFEKKKKNIRCNSF